MSALKFSNLHVHTNYSWDCISKIKDIIKFVRADGQTAVAMTDHGNLNGAVEFFKEAKKQGILPIIGIEFYICKPGKFADDKSSSNKSLNHLVCLAKNLRGYQNLLKMVKISNENYYYKPRIDEDILFNHCEGLIVINGHMDTSIHDCLFFNLDGVSKCESIDETRQYLYPDYEDKFLEVANKYKKWLGDDFYIEIQLFDQTDIVQQAAGSILIELANKYNFRAVATGDAHYIEPKDAIFHKVFCAISHNTKMSEMPDIGYFNSGNYGLITRERAQTCYGEDLIRNTCEIVSKIEPYDITLKTEIPKFNIENPKEYIYNICVDRLKELDKYNSEYLDRLDYELSILELGDLYDYFLIVSDYVQWAKSNDILAGPGRGSGGGSLTGYLMRITGMDPIEYNLLFDRFFSFDRSCGNHTSFNEYSYLKFISEKLNINNAKNNNKM